MTQSSVRLYTRTEVDALLAAQAASDAATYVTYDGMHLLKDGTVVPISSDSGANDSDAPDLTLIFENGLA